MLTAIRPSRDAASKTDSELWMAVYASNLARIGAKICQNTFRTIPNISFFDIEKKNRNFERPFTHRGWLHSASNFGKRVSGDPQYFIFRHPKFFLTKIFVEKKSSTLRKKFQQSACFGGAVKVWTSPSDAHRKFIARHIGFSLPGPLAEG